MDPEDNRPPNQIPEEERDYYLERIYPAFGNLVPRDVASRAAMRMIDQNRGVGSLKNGVYLDFAEAISRLGRHVIEERYGNLFEMYERITDEDPYQVPMRIYPAPHYTMGGLWVDYNLMTNVSGLYSIGESNFSDHGANRLGASALMQGLADGYFVLPYTIADYLAHFLNVPLVPTDSEPFQQVEVEVKERLERLLAVDGDRTVDSFHRELGTIMIDKCGLARSREGLEEALETIPQLRDEFWQRVKVPGTNTTYNPELSKAARVADFLELAELMCRDALEREESCGGHFRLEHQTEDGEAKRDDVGQSHVSAWEWNGYGEPETHNKEPLEFEYVKLAQRSYK
jgi:succinate dehydrogenase / fumarate reductase flavoprotein subunit